MSNHKTWTERFRAWRAGKSKHPVDDFADLGTAFGLEMSLRFTRDSRDGLASEQETANWRPRQQGRR